MNVMDSRGLNTRHRTADRNAGTIGIAHTKQQPIVLDVREKLTDSGAIRSMFLEGREITFKITSPLPLPALETWDFALIGAIFTAMRLNRPLHVNGPVSRSLLANLEEFQNAWATWLPKDYSAIAITANSEIDSKALFPNRAVVAFSGGVDSTYSLLAHKLGDRGRLGFEPVAGVMIKGFDIGINDDHAMQIACKNSEAMLSQLGMPLAIVETNWKQQACHNWRMEYMSGLVACLAQFSGISGAAVIGGDGSYHRITVPLGSNLVTNALFSSNGFQIKTEGSKHTRSDRLAYIAQNSNLAPLLRVCWEKADTGKNCGRCEKCIRTQLNLRANGLKTSGFIHQASFLDIAFMPTYGRADIYQIMDAQRTASRNRIRSAWRIAASIAIGKNILFLPMVLLKAQLKSMVRRNNWLYSRFKNWWNTCD